MDERWDDWVALATGAAIAVSWIWHGMFGIGMVLLFLFGLATVFASVLSLTRPGMVSGEAVLVVVGALVFLTPWLVGFADKPAAAWTAWIGGAVIAAMGVVGLPLSRRRHGALVPHGPDGSATRSPTAHSFT